LRGGGLLNESCQNPTKQKFDNLGVPKIEEYHSKRVVLAARRFPGHFQRLDAGSENNGMSSNKTGGLQAFVAKMRHAKQQLEIKCDPQKMVRKKRQNLNI